MLPKLKTDVLLKEINSYLDREEKPDEFTVRRWQREAESLSKSDPVGKMMLFGILAAIQNDIAAMRANFERALAVSPGNEYVLLNYAVSLKKTGFLREAAEKICPLSMARPDNLDYLNLAIDVTITSGMISQSIELVKIWEKLNPGDDYPHKEILERLNLLMNRHNITDGILEQVIAIPYTILHKYGICFRSRMDALDVRNDDGDEWLDYEITLPSGLSDEKIFELDEALINAYSDSDLPAEVLQYFSPIFSTAGYA